MSIVAYLHNHNWEVGINMMPNTVINLKIVGTASPQGCVGE